MNRHRRTFLKQSSLITGGLLLSSPWKTLTSFSNHGAADGSFNETISILHTNDLRNHIDPLASGAMKGCGGLRNLQRSLSDRRQPFSLMDAGDFLGEDCTEMEHREMIVHMNHCKYKAATIGDRELCNGQDYLATLIPSMNFPLVNCNYTFSHPYLKTHVLPFHIIKDRQYKIGITGVGVQANQLKNDKGIVSQHPYKKANAVAKYLKEDLKCNLVICLTHLGYRQPDGQPHSIEFAQFSSHIDVIASGHTLDIVPNVNVRKNSEETEVIISHAGSKGLLVKECSFKFNALKEKQHVSFRNIFPGSIAGSSYSAIREAVA